MKHPGNKIISKIRIIETQELLKDDYETKESAENNILLMNLYDGNMLNQHYQIDEYEINYTLKKRNIKADVIGCFVLGCRKFIKYKDKDKPVFNYGK